MKKLLLALPFVLAVLVMASGCTTYTPPSSTPTPVLDVVSMRCDGSGYFTLNLKHTNTGSSDPITVGELAKELSVEKIEPVREKIPSTSLNKDMNSGNRPDSAGANQEYFEFYVGNVVCGQLTRFDIAYNGETKEAFYKCDCGTNKLAVVSTSCDGSSYVTITLKNVGDAPIDAKDIAWSQTGPTEKQMDAPYGTISPGGTLELYAGTVGCGNTGSYRIDYHGQILEASHACLGRGYGCDEGSRPFANACSNMTGN